jgi:hypothetical protein
VILAFDIPNLSDVTALRGVKSSRNEGASSLAIRHGCNLVRVAAVLRIVKVYRLDTHARAGRCFRSLYEIGPPVSNFAKATLLQCDITRDGADAAITATPLHAHGRGRRGGLHPSSNSFQRDGGFFHASPAPGRPFKVQIRTRIRGGSSL